MSSTWFEHGSFLLRRWPLSLFEVFVAAPFYLQAAIADPAGVFQVVLTNALEMRIAE